MTVTDLISIIDADPDLGDLLEPADRDRARSEALTRTRHIPVGDWDVSSAAEPEQHHHGFMMVDGLISREVEVMGRTCIELLGVGDVLRPWKWDLSGSAVHAEVGWTVLDATDLAVLDHGLITRISPWPELGLELFARGTRRAHALAVTLAITHHQRVDDRLLLTLWHLAERWGRVGPSGITVPLPLSHQRLANLVGAHRPSVTTAMGVLAREGMVSRAADGNWVLHGRPPELWQHHRLAEALGN